MTRLNIDYQGFKLGVRIADTLALSIRMDDQGQIAGLHAIKGIAHVIQGMREYQAFAVNGQTYAK